MTGPHLGARINSSLNLAADWQCQQHRLVWGGGMLSACLQHRQHAIIVLCSSRRVQCTKQSHQPTSRYTFTDISRASHEISDHKYISDHKLVYLSTSAQGSWQTVL